MMTDSQTFLDTVRRALAHRPARARPVIPASRAPGSRDAEIALLLAEIANVGATARRVRDDELDAALRALIDAEQIKSAALWATPNLARWRIAERLRALDVEIIPHDADKHTLARVDLGITEADYALPESGTLGLLAAPEKPRALSLVPPVHLVLVTQDALRADLRDVFTEAKSQDYLVMITGPSRTADIEFTLTIGVHGTKSLHVWMME